jgi:hypothetical protein
METGGPEPRPAGEDTIEGVHARLAELVRLADGVDRGEAPPGQIEPAGGNAVVFFGEDGEGHRGEDQKRGEEPNQPARRRHRTP